MTQSLLVLTVASMAAFGLLHLAPGDPFNSFESGIRSTPAARAMQRARLGLDEPLPQQYGRWLVRYVRGDLGWSTSAQRPVADVLRDTLPRTLLLMGLAFACSLVGGVLLGAWQGMHVGTRRDRVGSLLSLLLFSCPEYVLAVVLLLSLAPAVFPASGLSTDGVGTLQLGAWLADRVWHLILPVSALALVGIAVIARFERAAVREVVSLPFIQAARARGLRERTVRYHAIRASLLPVISLVGLLLPSLMAGAVFVETVFSWPGMGLTLLRAIESRDYDVVMAGVVLVSAMTTLGSMFADILRDLADPRARATA